jgi:beta-lactamase class A
MIRYPLQSIFARNVLYFLMVFFFPRIIFCQQDFLREKISGIIQRANGLIGVAIAGLENTDTLTFNNDNHYPMQSVFKFPLALAVLRNVDKGVLSLDQQIHIDKKDLHPNTWSPLREKYPNGDVDITLSELLTFTVSESDNNGCDLLFQLIGGPDNVSQFVHSLGIKDMEIVATEEDMHKDWEVQYKNWTTPFSLVQLLSKFVSKNILSAASKDFLWNVMSSTITGPGRLKGQLPAGTVVAHKTGSSGTNQNGIAAATNDVGIVTLPNGQQIVIAVLIKDSPDDNETRDNLIAVIAKAAWDSYSNHKE